MIFHLIVSVYMFLYIHHLLSHLRIKSYAFCNIFFEIKCYFQQPVQLHNTIRSNQPLNLQQVHSLLQINQINIETIFRIDHIHNSILKEHIQAMYKVLFLNNLN
jgi:UDP-galactopyranose mutase